MPSKAIIAHKATYTANPYRATIALLVLLALPGFAFRALQRSCLLMRCHSSSVVDSWSDSRPSHVALRGRYLPVEARVTTPRR